VEVKNAKVQVVRSSVTILVGTRIRQAYGTAWSEKKKARRHIGCVDMPAGGLLATA
jgi:hypothetical protein